MIQSVAPRGFGPLPDESYRFCSGLNVVLGSNGTGKSMLLKLAYSASRWSYEMSLLTPKPDKSSLQRELAGKLLRVFRPDYLGRLCTRSRGRQRTDVKVEIVEDSLEDHLKSFRFSFSSNSRTEAILDESPSLFSQTEVIFFPTKEVLSIYPGFAASYQTRELGLDETYYDLCQGLSKSLTRGPRLDQVKPHLESIEDVLGGRVRFENGRFEIYRPGEGIFEMPLVAEGFRKIATVAYLLANGTVTAQSTLYWDEPETNLNPQYISALAKLLVDLSSKGIQVIVATHSLFFLREISLLTSASPSSVRFFALGRSAEGEAAVSIADSIDEINPITALDEEISQSERYLWAAEGRPSSGDEN